MAEYRRGALRDLLFALENNLIEPEDAYSQFQEARKPRTSPLSALATLGEMRSSLGTTPQGLAGLTGMVPGLSQRGERRVQRALMNMPMEGQGQVLGTWGMADDIGLDAAIRQALETNPDASREEVLRSIVESQVAMADTPEKKAEFEATYPQMVSRFEELYPAAIGEAPEPGWNTSLNPGDWPTTQQGAAGLAGWWALANPGRSIIAGGGALRGHTLPWQGWARGPVGRGLSAMAQPVKGVAAKALRPLSFRQMFSGLGGNVQEGLAGLRGSTGVGAASPALLANAGLLGAAGLATHKLGTMAAGAYEGAEAAEAENLSATERLMEAMANKVKAGYMDPNEFDRWAQKQWEVPDAGFFDQIGLGVLSSQPRLTDEEVQRLQNRYSVLRANIGANTSSGFSQSPQPLSVLASITRRR